MEVRIPRDEYIKLNTTLSRRYAESEDPQEKREIIKCLYDICLPLFKEWNLFDKGAIDDFRQEAFLTIEKALGTFKPDKGAFLSWLRTFYIPGFWKTLDRRVKKQGKEWELLESDESEEFVLSEDYPDFLFWRKVRGDATEKEWLYLQEIFFKGKKVGELSDKMHAACGEMPRIKRSIFRKIKAIQLHDGQKYNTKTDYYEERWLKLTEFAEKMSFSYRYLRELVSPKSRLKYYINPLDMIRDPVCRIHYLSRNGELVLPRFVRRR